MAVIKALLICLAVVVFMGLVTWEALTRPRYLKSVLVWSAVLGGMAFVGLVGSGEGILKSLGALALLPVVIATVQLRFRVQNLVWRRRKALDANYDAWGNPRRTGDAPGTDEKEQPLLPEGEGRARPAEPWRSRMGG